MSLVLSSVLSRLGSFRSLTSFSKAFHSSCNFYPYSDRLVNTDLFLYRCQTLTSSKFLHTSNSLMKKARVSITFEKSDGNEVSGVGKEGESVLDVVVNNNLDLQGYGACEGTLSCSTCHIILQPEDFQKLSEKASDEELDMLDLAPDVSNTSRLGCQVTVTKDMEGLRVKVPSAVRDAREFPDSDSVKR